MARLTEQELEAIRKRAEKASAGPWLPAGGKFGEPVVTSYRDGINITEEVIYDFDAEFIANSREDIPKLLAEVARLQSQVDRMVSSAYEYLDTSTHTYLVAEEIEREDA